MPHPTDNADPQPSKKGFFASLFARHRAPVSSSKQTAPQPQLAQPIPEPEPRPRHPLQDEIDALLARLSQTLSNARLHSFGSKERDVLVHQYGQALRAYRRGGSEKDQATITSVLNEILIRLRNLLKALDERTRRIAPTVSESTGACGFATKKLGDAYEGETLARGWRETDEPPEGTMRHQIWKLLRNAAIDKITEGEWDQTKRDRQELRIAEDGHAYTRDGDNHPGYVLDSDGKTYMFSGESRKRELTEAELQKIDDNLSKIEPLEKTLRDQLVGASVTAEDLQVARDLRILRRQASNVQLQPADKATSDKLRKDLAACEQRLKELSERKGIDVFEAAWEWQYLQHAKTRLENAKRSKKVELATHHSSPTGGKPVAGAGELKRDIDGKIVEISNVSGHYKPMFVHLAQTIEHLMRQGAFLDKTLVFHDQEGNKRRIDEDPELNALYHRVVTKLPELEQIRKAARAVIKKLDDLPQQLNEEQRKVEQAALEQEMTEYRARLQPIEEALHVLRKLGAGPANQASDARVVFIDNIQDKGGLQIHLEAQNVIDKPTVGEFLKSGGGHRVYAKTKVEEKGGYTSKTVEQAKGEMLDELKKIVSKGVGKKEVTDTNDATDRAEKKTGKENKVLGALKAMTEQFDKDAEGRPDALKKEMGDAAFAQLMDTNKAPTSDDIKRALDQLQPQDMHERINEPGIAHRHGSLPDSNTGQNYVWSDPSAPTAQNGGSAVTYPTPTENPKPSRERGASELRGNIAAADLGEGYPNQETSESAQPGDRATTRYAPLKLDESGIVAAQTIEDHANDREREDSGSGRNMPASELGEGFQNQGTSQRPLPGKDVANSYTKLKLDENVEIAEASVTSRIVTGQGYVVKHGYVGTPASSPNNKRDEVATQPNAGYASVPRDSDSPSKKTKQEDKGFAIPDDYIKQVEQKYKRKVQRISGQGLNCYIRSILTGVRNAGWSPRSPQTLDSVINEIAGVLGTEGLRAPDGLIDAGGRDGARVRDLVKQQTGREIGLRIITWDRTNARITAFDQTAGAVAITLVHTPGHFDLLA
jgi:hypothetical protein